MNDANLRGWGYEQIGWLLDEVRREGGKIPDLYFPPDGGIPGSLDELEAVQRAQKAAREARLLAGRRIAGAFAQERLHPELTKDSVATQRKDRAARVEGQMRRALAGLCEDPWLVALLSDRMSVDPGTREAPRSQFTAVLGIDVAHGGELYEVLAGMERAVSALTSLRDELPDAALLDGEDLTPQEIRFQGLAEAYRWVVEAEPLAGMVKTYHAHSGPFVAFVRAAFTLEGESVPSDATLTKALQRTLLNSGKDSG